MKESLKIIALIVLLCFGLEANAQIEKPVTWSYAAKRISPTEALLYLKADIAGGWHIYSVNQKEGGFGPSLLNSGEN